MIFVMEEVRALDAIILAGAEVAGFIGAVVNVYDKAEMMIGNLETWLYSGFRIQERMNERFWVQRVE